MSLNSALCLRQPSQLIASFATLIALLAMEAVLIRAGVPWPLTALVIVTIMAARFGSAFAVAALGLSVAVGDTLFKQMVVQGHMPSPSPEMPFVQLIFVTIGSAIPIVLVHTAKAATVRADARTEVVSYLETTMRPETLPKIEGYDIAGLSSPASDDGVGGDFYDVYPMPGGLYGIMMGDVLGKGKEAAASTALLRYSVRAHSNRVSSPARVLTLLSEQIAGQGGLVRGATLFVGTLDPRTGVLEYASAGHEPPMIVGPDGVVQTLDGTGCMLGLGEREEYELRIAEIAPGATLLLSTDGLVEARSSYGEFMGPEGAQHLFRAASCAPTASLAVALLMQGAADHIGNARRDDIALLMLVRTALKDVVYDIDAPATACSMGDARSGSLPLIVGEGLGMR
ncbi:MAG TPA: PP2C family protein-serine/threonine phosphatase [Capsulimonadaceae bacterium]